MADRERLEAELRARWTPENLAVYADFLQAQGDPLGELILVGLRVDAGDAELRAHHDQLLDRLGVAKSSRSLVKTGFVPNLTPSDFALLATPVGRHVRQVALYGLRTTVHDELRELGHRPSPWLERVEIRVIDAPRRSSYMREPEGDGRALVTTLATQAPHVREVDIGGAWLAGWSAARELAALAVDLPALRELAASNEVLAGVTSLVLALVPGPVYDDRGDLAGVSLARQLPALRKLVIGRANESAVHLHKPVFDWLARTEIVRDLVELVVPAPRAPEHVRTLEQIRNRFAGRLEVTRAYAAFPFAIPGVIVPPLRPWPPPDVESRRLRFVVGTNSARFTPDELDHRALVTTLDQLADRGPFALVPWQKLYAALGAPMRTSQVPLALVLDAIDTLPPDLGGDIGAFAARIRELPPALRAIATVQVSVLST